VRVPNAKASIKTMRVGESVKMNVKDFPTTFESLKALVCTINHDKKHGDYEFKLTGFDNNTRFTLERLK